MEVFMHHRDQPRRARLALRVLRLADHNHCRPPKSRKGCLESGWELSRTRIQIIADLREILRWRGMRQEFSVLCYQHQRRRHLVPVGPDPILNLGCEPVELLNPHCIVGRKLPSRRLGKSSSGQQYQRNQKAHETLDEGDDPGLAHRAQLAGTPFRTTQAMPGYSAFLAEGWGSPA